MAVHSMSVKAFLLPFLIDGSKTLEIRVADGRATRIGVGDTIIFNRTLHKKVLVIRKYTNFEEMLEGEDVSQIHPTASSGEILSALSQFYSHAAEALGVLVFELEAIS